MFTMFGNLEIKRKKYTSYQLKTICLWLTVYITCVMPNMYIEYLKCRISVKKVLGQQVKYVQHLLSHKASQKQLAESYLNEELMDQDKQLVGMNQEDIQPVDSLVEDSRLVEGSRHHHVEGSRHHVEGILVVDSLVVDSPVEGTDQKNVQQQHGPAAKRVLCQTHHDEYPFHHPFFFYCKIKVNNRQRTC